MCLSQGDTIWIIIGCVLIPLGIWTAWSATQRKKKYEAYEFENRTDGGVVQFQTYEASKKHKLNKDWCDFFIKLGVWLVVIGVLLSITILTLGR